MKLTSTDYLRAEKNGISINTLQTRLYRLKWDKERAISVSPQKSVWERYKEIAAVSRSTFYDRISRGWEPQKAATTKPMRNQYK